MKSILYKISFKTQLRILILFMVLGLVLMTLFYYWSFSSFTIQRTNEYFTTIFDLLYSRVEAINYRFNYTVQSISTNRTLQRYVTANEEEQEEIQPYMENVFLDIIRLPGRETTLDVIEGIALLKKHNISVLSGNAKQELLQIADDYQLTRGITYFTSVYTRLYSSYDSTKMYYAYIQPIKYHAMQNESYSSVQAYCLYLCNTGVIQDALRSANLPKDAEVFLYSYDEKILASTNETHVGSDISQTFGEDISWRDVSETICPLQVDDLTYLAAWKCIGTTEWNMVLMIPQNRLLEDIYPIRSKGLLLGICIGCFFAFLCLIIVRTISYQISDLSQGMEKVSKFDVHYRLSARFDNELQTISEQINQMLDRVEKSADEALAAKEQLYINEIERQHAEMYALQSQIYPHFLYNTLECIRSIALYRGVNEISQIATAMGNIFRYCITSSEFSSLQEELNCIQEYFTILQIRFDGRLRLELDIPSEYRHLQIPKMTLQPVVENAVYHGLERVYHDGVLKISCEDKDNYLILTISDNGCGMDPDQFAQLEKQLKMYNTDFQQTSTSGIGLLNIQRRLKVTYGDPGGVWIHSQKGIGTTVNLVIAKKI